MESDDLEVVRTACAWRVAGAPVTLVTVARIWGSSPRPVGSIAAIRGDGQLAGSISGGCLEPGLASRIAATEIAPRTERMGFSPEEALRMGLPCGGRLELVLEPLGEPGALLPVQEALEARRRIARRLVLSTGETTVFEADRDREFHYDGRVLEKVFGPVWRVLIIGAGQLSRQIARMASALDYEVIVCDPRERYIAAWAEAGVTLDRNLPDEAVRTWADDPRSAVLALTHDPRLDDLALMEALESEAFYVGALGSQTNNDRRRTRLRSLLGLSEDRVRCLHGPVGLPIGSRTPAEIAIAILAELIGVRHGRQFEPRDQRTASPPIDTARTER